MSKRSWWGAETAALLLACSVCFGQAIPSAETPGRHYEAWGGFSKLRGDFGTDHKASGWIGGFTLRLNPHLGFDATATGNYATANDGRPTNVHTILLTPRFSVPVWRISPFIHAGLGVARWKEAGFGNVGGPLPDRAPLSIAKTVGVGIDLRINKHFSLRGEGDYIKTTFLSGDNGLVSGGIVYRFR